MCDESDPPPCEVCGGEQYVEYCDACVGTGRGAPEYDDNPWGGYRQYGCEECKGEGWYLVCADCSENLLTEEVQPRG